MLNNILTLKSMLEAIQGKKERKNWLKWHKVRNYKDTLHSHNVSSQLVEVIVMMKMTLWTDEISGIDRMMTEWTLQWQWDSGRQTIPSPGAVSRERSVTERWPSGRWHNERWRAEALSWLQLRDLL